MNAKVHSIADAVLYEGYMLYPYRPSSVKNRQRWTFGGVFPEGWGGDPSSMHAELLLTAGETARVAIQVRFLHLLDHNGWQEAMEREVVISESGEHRFSLPAWSTDDRRQEQVDGVVAVSSHQVAADLHRLTIHVTNLTEFNGATTRDEASLQAFIGAHVIAEISGGEFISLTDPPERYREAAGACSNVGVWPVLAGDAGSHDCMLASPIILYDYPQVAPESLGDLFDGAEIDEILTLRIMTMTDAEKAEMRASDERARRILERTELLAAEEFMKLHGVLRNRI